MFNRACTSLQLPKPRKQTPSLFPLDSPDTPHSESTYPPSAALRQQRLHSIMSDASPTKRRKTRGGLAMKTPSKSKHPSTYLHDLPLGTFTYGPYLSNMASECAPRRDLQSHHIIRPSFQYPESTPRQQGVRSKGCRVSLQIGRCAIQT
jgi:hypothetical protein